jgi:hypothetical protein
MRIVNHEQYHCLSLWTLWSHTDNPVFHAGIINTPDQNYKVEAMSTLKKQIRKIIRTHKLNIESCEIATDELIQIFIQELQRIGEEVIGKDELPEELQGIKFVGRPDGQRDKLRDQQRAKLAGIIDGMKR